MKDEACMTLTGKYGNEKITLRQTEEKNFFIFYKAYRLDLGGQTIEKGLINALRWFGDIRFEEGKAEVKND